MLYILTTTSFLIGTIQSLAPSSILLYLSLNDNCFVSISFQRLIPTHCHISSDLIIFFTLFFTIRYFETCIIQPLNLTEDGLGNLAALRTFRVLRALKTVAVIPGNSYRTLSSYMCLVKAYVTFSSPGMLRR